MRCDIEACYVAHTDRAKADTPAVTIVPRGDSWSLQSRGAAQHQYTLLIDVRKAVDIEDSEEINLLVKVVEEICDYLKKRKMAGANAVTAISDPQIYEPEELHTYHLFVSQIEATYTMQRGI